MSIFKFSIEVTDLIVRDVYNNILFQAPAVDVRFRRFKYDIVQLYYQHNSLNSSIYFEFLISEAYTSSSIIIPDIVKWLLENTGTAVIITEDTPPETVINKFSKIVIVPIENGQTEFVVTSKPDNIDLIINRVYQIQNVDYTYTSSTGALEIINASIGNSIKTTSNILVNAHSSSLSNKEVLTISTESLSTYTLSDTPRTIQVIFNRTFLLEGIDYTYNTSTGDFIIINDAFIDQITLNSIIEIRKYY